MTEKQRIIKTVYLSGAMDMVGVKEGKNWRSLAEKKLDEKSIDVFNPYRKPVPAKGTSQKPGVVVRQDLRIIDQSDLMLVNLAQTVTCPHCGKDTEKGVQSHGTASECMYAWGKNIPIVAFVGEKEIIPRWLDEQAEYICRTLEEALSYIFSYNRRKEGGDEGIPAKVEQYTTENKEKKEDA